MRVKTFQGRTLEEVLPQIRTDLGPEAVVLSQRPLISGGVGGFFGKRMVEVTAADRMPDDSELVDLERQFTEDSGHTEPATPEASGGRSPERQTEGQFPQAGLNMVDDWDPAHDEELAREFGGVLQRANENAVMPPLPAPEPTPAPMTTTARGAGITEAGTYEPLALPRRAATVAAAPDIDTQAHDLASRAHEAIAAATREIERQMAADGSVAYEPEVTVAPQGPTTFRAEVISAPSGPRVGLPQPSHAYSQDLAPRELVSRTHLGRTSGGVAGAPVPARNFDREAIALGDLLASTGVERDIADVMVGKAAMHRMPFVAGLSLRDVLRNVVQESIPVETGSVPTPGKAHHMALVGPSGAGKSSIAGKLAEGYERGCGMRVAVVSILAGVSANPPRHANDPLLGRPGIDLYFAADTEQMLTVLERVRDRDLVIFDTPSSAYLDASARTQVAACLAVADVQEVHAVVPLATSLREAESVVDHYRSLGVNRLMVSKLDESRFAGQLLNFGYRLGLPITFLSDGPAIPEDLRAASAQEIATLIVPQGDERES